MGFSQIFPENSLRKSQKNTQRRLKQNFHIFFKSVDFFYFFKNIHKKVLRKFKKKKMKEILKDFTEDFVKDLLEEFSEQFQKKGPN